MPEEIPIKKFYTLTVDIKIPRNKEDVLAYKIINELSFKNKVLGCVWKNKKYTFDNNYKPYDFLRAK